MRTCRKKKGRITAYSEFFGEAKAGARTLRQKPVFRKLSVIGEAHEFVELDTKIRKLLHASATFDHVLEQQYNKAE
jgi:hypothetical protein